MIITCDVGSTNLKIQKYIHEGEVIIPVDDAQIITHNQDWLNDRDPIQYLSKWLDDVANVVVDVAEANDVNLIGFSTFREGIIGLNKANEIVFVGTNLQKNPVGNIANVDIMTTLAGWLCWKISGIHATTKGQRDAGSHYINRLPDQVLRFEWAKLVNPGMHLSKDSLLKVYIGGTDEQLGYMGTGIFDKYSSDIVMATGTFWSISFMSDRTIVKGSRRTDADGPFKAVDSFVFYRWGPMLKALASSEYRKEDSQEVSSRYFGDAAKLWFEEGADKDQIKNAVVSDLQEALRSIPKRLTPKTVIVYGGGVNLDFAKNLIMSTCDNMNIVFMREDATSLGCARVGLSQQG